MGKYMVEITETLTYKIEVEGANNESHAEELTFASEDFANNLFKDNDAVASKIEKNWLRSGFPLLFCW